MSVSAPSTNPRTWLQSLVAVAIMALDQYTKHWIRQTMPVNSSREPIPAIGHLLTFTHLENTGGAFGLFRDTNTVFIVLALIVATALMVMSRKLAGAHWMLPIVFGMQVGGALGNVIDRVWRGAVTDFIDVHVWPVFNVADSSVVVGTILLGIYALFLDRPARSEGAEVPPEPAALAGDKPSGSRGMQGSSTDGERA